MKYYAVFNIPDDQTVFKGRPALLFSHSEDSEVLTVTIAEEIISEESLNDSIMIKPREDLRARHEADYER